MAAILSYTVVLESSARNTNSGAMPQAVVILARVSPPTYPPVGRTAHITGDVVVMVNVRQDGSVESVLVVSGSPLLGQAALESAQHSQFECRECTDRTTSYQITYTFRLDSSGCCASADGGKQNQTYPHITQSDNHVTVVDLSGCICDPISTRKIRSMKCLYLWRCGNQ